MQAQLKPEVVSHAVPHARECAEQANARKGTSARLPSGAESTIIMFNSWWEIPPIEV